MTIAEIDARIAELEKFGQTSPKVAEWVRREVEVLNDARRWLRLPLWLRRFYG